MADDSQEVADIIDALGEAPAPLDVYNATRDYDTRYLASAGAAQAAADGGGGSQPQSEWLYGGQVAIDNGSAASLTWDNYYDGDVLLDLTDPANPTVLTDGVYLVTIEVSVSALTLNGSFDVALALDLNGINFVLPFNSGAPGSILTSGAAAYKVPAGGVINVYVANNDGVTSRNFTLSTASVTKL